MSIRCRLGLLLKKSSTLANWPLRWPLLERISNALPSEGLKPQLQPSLASCVRSLSTFPQTPVLCMMRSKALLNPLRPAPIDWRGYNLNLSCDLFWRKHILCHALRFDGIHSHERVAPW